jgi:hypothetical protein
MKMHGATHIKSIHWLQQLSDVKVIKTLFHAPKYKTLTMCSLQAGNISSTLCSIILGTFDVSDMGLLSMLKTCSSHMMIFVCVTKNVLSAASQFQ